MSGRGTLLSHAESAVYMVQRFLAANLMYLTALSWLPILLTPASAADNGLAKTPQMGWNTWNHFGCSINENLILDAAKAVIQNNLTSLGYQCAYFS